MEELVTGGRPGNGAAAARPTRVLVTGADGFIGSVLTPLLVDRGFEVTGLDTGFYGAGLLYHDGRDRPRTLTRDIRHLAAADLEGFDAVVHLAELSNDPLCQHDPKKTYEINHLGSVALARAARRPASRGSSMPRRAASWRGGRRRAQRGVRTQSADRLRRLQEAGRARRAGAGKRHVQPNVPAQCHGVRRPPRIRFDIVLNNLAGLAWTTGRITMTSDGMPWRPLVHVRDISAAIAATLEAPREAVASQILNVGDNDNNYRVREIAEAIGAAFPNCKIEFGSNAGDNRSYRVCFDKIRQVLPGFRCEWTAAKGALQMRSLFEHIAMTEREFNAPPFTRLHQLQHLLATRQIDPDFYWRPHDLS